MTGSSYEFVGWSWTKVKEYQMVTDTFHHSCFAIPLFMIALKPEPSRPTDAYSDRFFRVRGRAQQGRVWKKQRKASLMVSAKDLGCPFFLVPFSLDSKEKEQSGNMAILAADQTNPWNATHSFDLSTHLFHNMTGKMYPHILATNQVFNQLRSWLEILQEDVAQPR